MYMATYLDPGITDVCVSLLVSLPGLLRKPVALVLTGVPPEEDTTVPCELGMLKDRAGDLEEPVEGSGPKISWINSL